MSFTHASLSLNGFDISILFYNKILWKNEADILEQKFKSHKIPSPCHKIGQTGLWFSDGQIWSHNNANDKGIPGITEKKNHFLWRFWNSTFTNDSYKTIIQHAGRPWGPSATEGRLYPALKSWRYDVRRLVGVAAGSTSNSWWPWPLPSSDTGVELYNRFDVFISAETDELFCSAWTVLVAGTNAGAFVENVVLLEPSNGWWINRHLSP